MSCAGCLRRAFWLGRAWQWLLARFGVASKRLWVEIEDVQPGKITLRFMGRDDPDHRRSYDLQRIAPTADALPPRLDDILAGAVAERRQVLAEHMGRARRAAALWRAVGRRYDVTHLFKALGRRAPAPCGCPDRKEGCA